MGREGDREREMNMNAYELKKVGFDIRFREEGEKVSSYRARSMTKTWVWENIRQVQGTWDSLP